MPGIRSMRGLRALHVLALGTVALAACAGAQQPRTSRLEIDTVHARGLEGNKYGDSPDREVAVYLPPSYSTNATARYPVVYLLHGYGGTERAWIRGYAGGFSIQPAMDSLVTTGAVREMIIVMPDARNRLGGSFYTNSESTGQWDDFVSKELVTYVDAKYRTLATASSRGIAGHSMGGFGTFYLSMRHAGDIFGAAYAMSACCTRFAHELTPSTTRVWRSIAELPSLANFRTLSFYQQIYLALSAAFSPASNTPPLFMHFPFEERGGAWNPAPAVQAEWAQHSPFDMLDADPGAVPHLKRLRGLAFDVGSHDQLVAPAQLVAMDSALTRDGVTHTFEIYDGDHAGHIGMRMITKVLPFFSRMLDFSASRRAPAQHTFK